MLSVKNRGDEMLDTSNLESFRVTNGATTRERIGLVSQTGSRFTQGLIVPGGTVRGFVAFEVGSGSEGWSFVFDVDSPLTTIERVTVDLGEQRRPRSLFRQSYRVPVHDVGGSVGEADLTVTVTDVRTTETVAKTTAAEGEEFLLPTVRVENGKSRTAYVGLTSQMLLVDDRGTPQALDLGLQQQIRNAFPLNPNVEPGSHVEGEIPYVVGSDTSPLYFSYDFSSNGAEWKSIWQLR